MNPCIPSTVTVLMLLFGFLAAHGEETPQHTDASADELVERVFQVTPDFLESATSAKEKLQKAGIHLPTGSSAQFLPSTAELVIRTTEEQMKLAEAYVVDVKNRLLKHLLLKVKMMTISPEASEGYEELFSSIVSSAKREGSDSTPPDAPSHPYIRGVFNDTQHHVMIHALDQDQEVGINRRAMPSLCARSPVAALIESPNLVSNFEIEALIADDGVSIDLKFTDFTGIGTNKNGFLLLEREGKWVRDEMVQFASTIWDGDTIILELKSSREEEKRLLFVTPRIVDPAGKPINPDLVAIRKKSK